MSARRGAMLAEMGVKPQWRLRAASAMPEAQAEAVLVQPMGAVPDAPVPALVTKEAAPLPDKEDVGGKLLAVASGVALVNAEGLDWDGLEQAVSDCRACRLCERRKQAVLGVGDRQAEWMFVGEGPGAEEDERGEPFVGQAGRLLDAMLASVGMQRSQNVYIANAVKCRPPGNRTPETEEMRACRPYLERQIQLVKPKLLIALGRPAAQTLLREDDVRIAASRKRTFEYEGGIPVVVTYHPAYLLRNLADKAKAWEDLCFVQDQMAQLKE